MLTTAALLLLATATADASDDKEEAKKACMNDYNRFCAGILPGGGRVKKCLGDNLDKLEPTCRDAVARKLGAANTAKPPETERIVSPAPR